MKIVSSSAPTKILVAITGASGAIYGIRLLKILNSLILDKSQKLEIHLIISNSARITIKAETITSISEIIKLTNYNYLPEEIGARISSGSYNLDAMIIAPCSMKTLASIAVGIEDNLISRSAQVILKEKKRLILMIRETPLNTIHIKNMLTLSRLGCCICPTVSTFYNKPKTIEEMVDFTIIRVLDLINIKLDINTRWKGLKRKI